MASTIGGDWKDLVKAAGEGDIGAARYHLLQGVDSNFQHPEYFTAPIFEAIRNNHLDMVQLLVQGYVPGYVTPKESATQQPQPKQQIPNKASLTNPQLVEEMTDMTPLELALSEEKHDIVHYLNSQLPPETQWKPRHVLVTGGNRGIGKAIVERLLRQGHKVAFTCRDETVGMEVAQELSAMTGNAQVQVIVGDLSSVASTKALAQSIVEQFPTLQILVHNAGLWPTDLQCNEDGLEMAFLVNYMAPYILTRQLLPRLQENGPDARVVLNTAGLFLFGKADVIKTPYGKDFSPLKTYMNTKQCGMIWCIHQAHLQQQQAQRQNGDETVSPPTTKTNVKFNAVHPGVYNTGLGDCSGCMGCILRVAKRFWRPASEGAIPVTWMAVSPEANDLNGEFYHEMQPYSLEDKGDAARVLDPSVQKEWMQWTEDFLARHDSDKKIEPTAIS